MKDKILSGVLCFSIIFGSLFVSGERVYAKKNPKLSDKKITIKVGKQKNIMVKNYSGKVKWKVLSGKGIIKLKDKKKKSVKIYAKKSGKAVVMAKAGKKKLKCKVIVKKTASSSETKTPVATSTIAPKPTMTPIANSATQGAVSDDIPGQDVVKTAEPVVTPSLEPTPDTNITENYENQVKALQSLINQINKNVRDSDQSLKAVPDVYNIKGDLNEANYEFDDEGNLICIDWMYSDNVEIDTLSDKKNNEGEDVEYDDDEESYNGYIISFADFPMLEVLKLDNNSLEGIDISKNTNLRNLSANCSGLTEIDITKNKKLENINLRDNSITTDGFKYSNMNNLEKLSIANNEIIDIDLTKMKNLTYLDCGGNAYTTDDLPQTTYSLKDINVSVLEKLETLKCPSLEITGIDLSDNQALREVDVRECRLTNIDVSSNINLETLYVDSNSLTSLNLKNNEKLKVLKFSDNKISNIDLSENVNLTGLYCSGCGLEALDVSSNTALKQLLCNDNKISELDLKNNASLIYVDCSSNEISNIYLWKGFALEKGSMFFCDDTAKLIEKD